MTQHSLQSRNQMVFITSVEELLEKSYEKRNQSTNNAAEGVQEH